MNKILVVILLVFFSIVTNFPHLLLYENRIALLSWNMFKDYLYNCIYDVLFVQDLAVSHCLGADIDFSYKLVLFNAGI